MNSRHASVRAGFAVDPHPATAGKPPPFFVPRAAARGTLPCPNRARSGTLEHRPNRHAHPYAEAQ